MKLIDIQQNGYRIKVLRNAVYKRYTLFVCNLKYNLTTSSCSKFGENQSNRRLQEDINKLIRRIEHEISIRSRV